VEAAYEARAEAAVGDILERAKSGEPAAMRLCMERAVPIGRHRRFAFALPRIRRPEDAEAAIDVVMDGLADGVLSLADVAELLRIVERLLEMAESIREMKRVRDLIARRPSAEPNEAVDEAEVQEALANLHAAARQLKARQHMDAHDADGDALYFPVNLQPYGTAGDVEVPPGPDCEAGRSPGRPETVAA
jgi:hypothetical protein